MTFGRLLGFGVVVVLLGVGCGANSVPSDERLAENIEQWVAEGRQNRAMLDNIEVAVNGCFPDGARGTVTNNNEEDFRLSIVTTFYDGQGAILNVQSDAVTVPAGQTAVWTVPHFHADADAAREHLVRILGYASCQVKKDHTWAADSPDDIVYTGGVESAG